MVVCYLQAIQLKIRGSHLTCKVLNKCLDVLEQGEIVKTIKKMVSSLPLLSCESSVSMKENPDTKQKYSNQRSLINLW